MVDWEEKVDCRVVKLSINIFLKSVKRTSHDCSRSSRLILKCLAMKTKFKSSLIWEYDENKLVRELQKCFLCSCTKNIKYDFFNRIFDIRVVDPVLFKEVLLPFGMFCSTLIQSVHDELW